MVKTKFFVLAGVLLLVLGYCGVVLAQDATPEQPAIMAPAPLPAGVFRPQGQVIVPDSSLPQEGMRAHTMHRIFQPAGLPVSTPTPMYTFAETPASMACLYKVGPTYAGCDDQLDVLAAIWGKW